ncbi:hypothetical protein HIM_00366 [Hirsutella minnesotensis 3608]|nr:hypothetical protein HIM_00366 [Hirsutella minnesotensis 3608]
MADNTARPKSARLAESSYLSPYSRNGAPDRAHPNTDPYAPLRSRALATLEAMGFDPNLMVEHGVLWAEHQDPFGHVMHTQFMNFMGTSLWRILESHDEFLTREECDNMIQAKTVITALKKYELDIRRQVKYPDALIAAYRQDSIEPTRSHGTAVLFSLKQQAIVAQVRGFITYVDVKTGRPVDIRTLGKNFKTLYEALAKRAESAKTLREQWERDNPKRKERVANL